MSVQVRRSPRLLKRLLAQPASTPIVQRKAAKRKIQLAEGEDHDSKKRKLDFIHSAYEAVSSDSNLSDELNVSKCHYGETGEQLLMVTTKAVYYHEPVKYLWHLKLVLTSSASYYIQVNIHCIIITG